MSAPAESQVEAQVEVGVEAQVEAKMKKELGAEGGGLLLLQAGQEGGAGLGPYQVPRGQEDAGQGSRSSWASTASRCTAAGWEVPRRPRRRVSAGRGSRRPRGWKSSAVDIYIQSKTKGKEVSRALQIWSRPSDFKVGLNCLLTF